MLADAPPMSRAATRAGRTLWDVNSGGNESAVSFSVLLWLRKCIWSARWQGKDRKHTEGKPPFQIRY